MSTIGFSQYFLKGNYNLDVYKPYTEAAQEYLLINDQVNSNTYSTSFFYRLQLEKQMSLNFGFTYKYIKHEVKDKILYVYEYEASGGQIVDSYLVNYPLDLRSRSHSLGILLDCDKSIGEWNKHSSVIGFGSEFYFFEDYKSRFMNRQNEEDEDLTSSNRHSRFWGISSINLSTYYRHSFQFHENFSLAARISLGTNLYSDWDQFKKYAWFGVGLEMGFGKVKQIGEHSRSEQ
jgi:hypothetical protein